MNGQAECVEATSQGVDSYAHEMKGGAGKVMNLASDS